MINTRFFFLPQRRLLSAARGNRPILYLTIRSRVAAARGVIIVVFPGEKVKNIFPFPRKSDAFYEHSV
jgi:hypothetical protein